MVGNLLYAGGNENNRRKKHAGPVVLETNAGGEARLYTVISTPFQERRKSNPQNWLFVCQNYQVIHHYP
jgi:hypothetical protein